MYLSRIELDISRRQTIRALASPYVLHAAIENCYPMHADKGLSRKLWRIDRLAEKIYLLLLSSREPDFSGLIMQFCDSKTQGESKLYDGLLSRVKEDQSWHFRLRANPVHSVKSAKAAPGRGKVYAHVTVEQQKQWLSQRAESCGFALSTAGAGDNEHLFDVVTSETIRFIRQQKPVTLGIAIFEGVLRVTDAALFKKALTEGIGRAKAFGCGLLTIASIS